MRKGNMTILASILAIILVAVGVGAGTMAYFSDTEKADVGQIFAATLDMQIYDSVTGWGDTEIQINSADLAPGDTFTVDIHLKNVGTTDIQYIYGAITDLDYGDGQEPESEWYEYTEGLHLVQMLILDGVNEQYPADGSRDCYNDFKDADTVESWLDHWLPSPEPPGYYDGSISLYDLVTYAMPHGDSDSTWIRFHHDASGVPGSPYLRMNEVVHFTFEFRLDEYTDNRAQGDWFGFNLVFIGSNAPATDIDDAV